MKRSILFYLLAGITQLALAQADFTQRYKNAKELFQNGKYNLAMETFRPLTTYDKNNPYTEYASFYYALSAYHQRYKTIAKDMLNQIRSLYPDWDQINEVNFWLSKIYFENHDYFQALKVVATIRDKKFEKDIEALKSVNLASVTDAETLKMMLEEHPDDAVIARILATVLAKNISDAEDKRSLEELIGKFRLKRSDFIPEAPQTIFKDRYSVSLLMPFMASTLEPTAGRKRNQLVLDFYEGLKLAVDTLSKQKIDISLRAYDTERNPEKLKRLLETEELKNTDLIIGPFYPEENKTVQEFSQANRINMVHPFSNSTDMIGINPYAFLYQPSSETLGKKSADFLAENNKEKICMVFLGSGKKDSVMASTFTQQALEKGITIAALEKVSTKDTRIIGEILATPTEFDEFKYPIQFTLKKDSISSIFVASDDPLIYTKVVSAVETRADSIMVVGSENWLDDNAIDLEKYQTLGIILAAPNYMDYNKPHYKAFEKKFIRVHGRVPGNVARMGYELMLFYGNQLKINGVYFQENLSKAGVVPGYLGEGFDFQFGRDNQLVPFISLQRGSLTRIQSRRK